MGTRLPWTRRRSGCAATSPSTARFWAAASRWAASWTFLTQELNREANTIGSKCQDLDITRIVVDMKAEIEKIREQIQNLE